MAESIYAAFPDASYAESAAGALLDHGVPASDISLVVSEAYNKRRGTPDDPELQYTQPTIVAGSAGGSGGRFDPLGNDLRQSGDVPIAPPNMPTLDQNAVEGLNQNEQPTPADHGVAPVEFDSMAPSGPDIISVEGLAVNQVDEADARIARDSDPTIGPAAYDPERAAKMGVTTTTIQDAAKAATKGAGFGLGVGAIAAIACIAIPGFGIVLGGGALAAAVAGIAATAGAGAVAGGVVGYLKDQGVPASDIPKFQSAYEGGGAILTVSLESRVNRSEIEDVLRKYGAQTVERYGYVA